MFDVAARTAVPILRQQRHSRLGGMNDTCQNARAQEPAPQPQSHIEHLEPPAESRAQFKSGRGDVNTNLVILAAVTRCALRMMRPGRTPSPKTRGTGSGLWGRARSR